MIYNTNNMTKNMKLMGQVAPWTGCLTITC